MGRKPFFLECQTGKVELLLITEVTSSSDAADPVQSSV